MDQVFSLKNKTFKKILENGKRHWKSQGIVLVRKSGNHAEYSNIKVILPHCSKDVFKHSFLPGALRGWNALHSFYPGVSGCPVGCIPPTSMIIYTGGVYRGCTPTDPEADTLPPDPEADTASL